MAFRSILVTLFFFFGALGTCSGLQDSAKGKYFTEITKSCPRHCCGPWTSRYNLKGSWVKESEAAVSNLKCIQMCFKHYQDCRKKCECLTSSPSVRSGACQCSPGNGQLLFTRQRCYNSCATGIWNCYNKCREGKGCAKAETYVSFSHQACGNCDNAKCCFGWHCHVRLNLTAESRATCIAATCPVPKAEKAKSLPNVPGFDSSGKTAVQ